MAIKTGKEYIDSVRRLKPAVYVEGQRYDDKTEKSVVDDPRIRPSLDTIAMVYDMANKPEYADIMTATSHLTGEKISRFTHICQSTEDLELKVRMLRLLLQKSGGVCIMRCSNLDGPASPYSITYDMDQKLGTEYHKRFKEFVKRVQQNDLYVNLAVTDPKGDRTLRPHEQKDPDMYLRVVKKNSDGIVVRGAKFHQTAAIGAHVRLITPTRALTAEEKAYAVMFSVPADAKGTTLVVGQTAPVEGWLEGKEGIVKHLARYSSHTTWTFFDDVFIPWEDVYMFGEYEYAAPLIVRFGGQHRSTYGGCFAGRGDIWMGIAAALAEIHGLSKDPIIKDKIVEMGYLSEVMFGLGIACAHCGSKTPSGVYIPDEKLANALKINISRAPYEQVRLLEYICGGIFLTIPSEKDLRHPDLKDRMNKYVKEVDGIPAEDRIRLVSLLNAALVSGTRGSLAGAFGSCCGAAGSEGAAKVHLRQTIDLKEMKRYAKIAAGIIKE